MVMRFIRDDLVDLAALRQAIAVLREACVRPGPVGDTDVFRAVDALLALDARQRAFQGTVECVRVDPLTDE
jgi:hypothetical protein